MRDDALGLLAAGHNATLTYGPDGERRGEGMRVFVWAFAPRPRLLVFGAIDFAAAVARVGAFLGYRVTVCDARPVFATHSRFPEADEVVVDWPHRYLAAEHEAGRVDPRTVVTVLTHDPKFDVPLLEVALRLPDVAYVGAMGSRRTHEDRMARLREAGLTEAELARHSSPIGLDLGARTPEETAISIAAEIIAGRWGGTGKPLRTTRGTIHRTNATSKPAAAVALSRLQGPRLTATVSSRRPPPSPDPQPRLRLVVPARDDIDDRVFTIATVDHSANPSEVEVVERLRSLAAHVTTRYSDIDRTNRLHRDDIDVLTYLSSLDAEAWLPVSELRHTLALSSGNASHRLASLEQRGWVRTERDLGDGRSRNVSLTDEGRAALRRLLEERRRAHASLARDIDDQDLRKIAGALRVLGAALENDAG